MWEDIAREFGVYPGQSKVARMMIKMGLRVKDGKIYCGEIRLSDVALARSVGVDRRVVRATAETINGSPELMKFFAHLQPVANLSMVAPGMGWGTVEISVDDADQPGILAEVSGIIANAGISVRQAIVEDPELNENPKLFVVTGSEVPPELIPMLRRAKGVRELTLR